LGRLGVKFMLDTNICIYIMNKRPPHVAETFAQHDMDDIGLSSIVVAELSYGARKSTSSRSKTALEQFLEPMTVVPFDVDAAHRYGELRAQLERASIVIGPLDLQISAHAMALNATLVTNNVTEFSRVNGLKVENWFA
jgi:tRNA(fMet)-specific endonuclease VapC